MLARMLNGVAAVLGAAAASQFPEFYQQYLQRLGGRVDQTRLELERLLNDAATLGRTLEAYLEELLASGTEAARLAAERELDRVGDADGLETAYQALSQAAPLERPFAFLWHFDPDIAADTLSVYAPALPATAEGAVYAAIGMVAGLGLMAAAEAGAGRARSRSRERSRARKHGAAGKGDVDTAEESTS